MQSRIHQAGRFACSHPVFFSSISFKGYNYLGLDISPKISQIIRIKKAVYKQTAEKSAVYQKKTKVN